MAGDLESIGEAVTAGLVARAVEPDSGAALGGETPATCLNCQAALTGPYCAQCGQKARVHRSLRAFFGDFAAGMLNFEGKLWRTLPLLAWRPGELSRRYIAGERARFISPVALYLFTVFVMFAVLNFNGAMDGPRTVREQMSVAVADERKALAGLEAARAQLVAARRDTTRIDRRIAAAKDDIARIEGIKPGQLVSDRDFDAGTPTWLRELVRRIQANPGQAVGKVQDAASKFSWLLIPLSLPFMWLLFPFSSRYRLYDHGVFVTYSLSFMMMLVIASGLLVAIGANGLAAMLFFVPPVHMYRQLRGAYGLGALSALIRTVLLLGFSFAAAGLFAALMIAIGIF